MEEDKNKEYICSVCGYVYDGNMPFEELPEDYVCPICNVDKTYFHVMGDDEKR